MEQLSLEGLKPKSGQATEAYRMEMLIGLFIATWSAPASETDMLYTEDESARAELEEWRRSGEISDIEAQNLARILGLEENF